MYLIPPFAVKVVDVHSSSRTGSYSDQGSMHGQTCSTYNTSRTWTNHWKVVQDAVVWVTFPRENKCTQTMKRYWIIKEGLCMWMAAPPLPSSPLSIFVNYQISGLSSWTISVVFHFSVSQLNLIEIGIHERLLTVWATICHYFLVLSIFILKQVPKWTKVKTWGQWKGTSA